MEQREPLESPLLGLHDGRTGGANGASAISLEMSTFSADERPKTPPKSRKNPWWSISAVMKFLRQLSFSICSMWQHTARFFKRTWKKKWTSETCSYVISVLALAGLVATLLMHHDKPLPQWPRLVTINSIISLFSLVMRASVGVVLAEGISQSKWQWFQKPRPLEHMQRLDSASRGSWGSISLLFNLRPKHMYYIAGLGALTTIMASLTGFFSQQLIQFQDCLQVDKSAFPGLAKSNYFSLTGERFQSMQYAIYPPMLAAIHVGIIQPVDDLTSVLSSGCTSGNCTFPEYAGATFQTVGVGHSCEDLTAKIRPLGGGNCSSDHPFTGINIHDGEQDLSELGFGYCQDSPTSIMMRTTVSRTGQIIKLFLLSRPDFSFRNYTAVGCELFPTLNTYAANITNGKLEEKLIDSMPIPGLHAQFEEPKGSVKNYNEVALWISHKMTTNYTIRNGKRESCAGSEQPQPGFVKFFKKADSTVVSDPELNPTEKLGWRWWYYPEDCVWSVHQFSITSMYDTFTDMFDGQEFVKTYTGGTIGTIHMHRLWGDGSQPFGTADGLMKNLTDSMTTVVRTNWKNESGSPLEAPNMIKGEMWVTTTCMYIRWPWISFPAVMIGFTGIFLALVTLQNRRVEENRLWKSSFLAALFCEVSLDARPVGKEEMKTVAKSSSVCLENKESDMLRLVAR